MIQEKKIYVRKKEEKPKNRFKKTKKALKPSVLKLTSLYMAVVLIMSVFSVLGTFSTFAADETLSGSTIYIDLEEFSSKNSDWSINTGDGEKLKVIFLDTSETEIDSAIYPDDSTISYNTVDNRYTADDVPAGTAKVKIQKLMSETTKFVFLKRPSTSSSTPKIRVYGNNGENYGEIGNSNVEMSQLGTSEYYYAEVSSTVTKVEFNIDGNNVGGQKTLPSHTNPLYIIDESNTNNGTWYEYTDFSSSSDNMYIVFQNNYSWSSIHLYGADSSDSPTLGAWGGTAMTYLSDNHQGYYYCEVPKETVKLVFNGKDSGNNNVQTVDLSVPNASSFTAPTFYCDGWDNGKVRGNWKEYSGSGALPAANLPDISGLTSSSSLVVKKEASIMASKRTDNSQDAIYVYGDRLLWGTTDVPPEEPTEKYVFDIVESDGSRQAVNNKSNDVNIISVGATYFDYYSDIEHNNGAWREPGKAGNNNDAYLGWHPFKQLNKIISTLSAEEPDWTYPLYIGNLHPEWKFNADSGVSYSYGYEQGIQDGGGKFNEYANNSRAIAVQTNRNEYDISFQQLMQNELKGTNSDELYVAGTDLAAPYFNEEWLLNGAGKGYSKVVHSSFPFRVEEKEGVTLYSFDSSNGKDNVFFSWDNNEPVEVNYGAGKNYGIMDGNADFVNGNATEGFFPFNTVEERKNGQNLNYGFGVRMDIEFRVTEDGTYGEAPGVLVNTGTSDQYWLWAWTDSAQGSWYGPVKDGDVITQATIGGNEKYLICKSKNTSDKAINSDITFEPNKVFTGSALRNPNENESTMGRLPITFDFEGDDDFWVYIDGELVLDMGGAHAKSVGQINFATGDVTVNKAVNKPGDSNETTVGSSNTSLPTDFKKGNSADATHTMTIFYMERGLINSNLKMSFSMTPLEALKKDLTIGKQVENASGTVISSDETFDFTVLTKAKGAEATAYEQYTGEYLYYEGGVASGSTPTTKNTSDTEGKVRIKAGDEIVIKDQIYDIDYKVVEDAKEGYSCTKITDGGTPEGSLATNTTAYEGNLDVNNKLVYYNREAPTTKTFSLSANKTLTGGTLTENAFDFKATAQSGRTMQFADGSLNVTTSTPDTYSSPTVKNAANGTVTFADIPYSSAGNYLYLIEELIPSTPADNIHYDSTKVYALVKVNESLNVSSTEYYTLDTDGKYVKLEGAYTFNNKLKGDIRFTKTDDSGNKLAGVTFKLYGQTAGSTTPPSFIPENEAKHVDGTAVTDVTTTVSSPANPATDGVVEFTDLLYGTYYIVETQTAAGHNLLAGYIKAVVSAEGCTLYYCTSGNPDGTAISDSIIQNNALPDMPLAGGIGQYIFYIVGGIIILGAVVLVIISSRKKKKHGGDSSEG